MSKILLSLTLPLFLLVVFFSIPSSVEAQTTPFTKAKATLSTSRPSASAPLSSNLAASAVQAVVIDNGSFYLASDSAKIYPDTGETIDTGIIVSSMTDNGSTLTISLATSPSNSHHAGNAFIVPATAMHTIEFTAASGIPDGGDIHISYPTMSTGDANNTASPSASTFQLNDVVSTANNGQNRIRVYNVSTSTDISTSVVNTYDNPSAGDDPDITITLSGTSIAAGNIIRIFLGCSALTGSGSSVSCSTEVPSIINPTKTNSAGVQDSWNVTITSRDASDVTINETTVALNTIESVQVQATVDPILTFSITGIAGSTAVNDGNNTECTQTDTTTAAATSTLVDLGSLSTTPIGNNDFQNLLAQRINIVTNAPNGYVLTATASSALLNPSNGYFLTSNTTPTVVTGGADIFGIHPCGEDVDASTWTETSSHNCNTHASGSTSPNANQCLLAWPTANAQPSTTALTLASDTSGPVDTSGPDGAGDGIVSITYAAGIDGLVPAGVYRAVITYIATPTF